MISIRDHSLFKLYKIIDKKGSKSDFVVWLRSCFL